jgi:hypothetical protein
LKTVLISKPVHVLCSFFECDGHSHHPILDLDDICQGQLGHTESVRKRGEETKEGSNDQVLHHIVAENVSYPKQMKMMSAKSIGLRKGSGGGNGGNGGSGSGNGSGNGNGNGNMSAIDLIVKDMMVTDHRFTNGATNVASSGASSVASSSSGLLPSGLLPSSSSRPEAKENVVARTARRSMIRRSSSAGVHGKAKLLGT